MWTLLPAGSPRGAVVPGLCEHFRGGNLPTVVTNKSAKVKVLKSGWTLGGQRKQNKQGLLSEETEDFKNKPRERRGAA